MVTLPGDITRCYGEDCDRKLACLRYQAIRQDIGGRFSFALSLMADNGDCDDFLPDAEDGAAKAKC